MMNHHSITAQCKRVTNKQMAWQLASTLLSRPIHTKVFTDHRLEGWHLSLPEGVLYSIMSTGIEIQYDECVLAINDEGLVLHDYCHNIETSFESLDGLLQLMEQTPLQHSYTVLEHLYVVASDTLGAPTQTKRCA